MESIKILKGDFGKAVLEECNARIKEDYHDNENLKVLKYDEKDVITGSNSFVLPLVNKITSRQGHTATQAELEKIIKKSGF